MTTSRLTLTIPQVRLLKALADDNPSGLSLTDAARLMGTSCSAMTWIKDRLVKFGLLRETHNPADRRKRMIVITRSGMNHLNRTVSQVTTRGRNR